MTLTQSQAGVLCARGDCLYCVDDFCAIAAVDNERVLDVCLKRSPDIASQSLPLITITGAPNMAAAYNEALGKTGARICVFLHQDVYLPAGWLERAVVRLNALSAFAPDWMVAGGFGVTKAGEGVGRVWDVTMGLELGAPLDKPVAVGSFDEYMLILRREEPFAFDEALPHFHLYGTDLAQTALAKGRSAWVVDLPVVHNNRPIVSLGGGYTLAYKYARRKWHANLPIYTTVCALSNNPLSLWRARWHRRHAKRRPDDVSADSVAVARGAGYEV